jgi:OCT family organic cation transporter-like MFS transporter 4/5
MAGKFFNTFTFFIVYIYTAELFPTVLRASVIGVSSMAGRVGAMTSAYIGELVRVNIRTLCMYIFCFTLF